jgi:hypothetical protein
MQLTNIYNAYILKMVTETRHTRRQTAPNALNISEIPFSIIGNNFSLL